MRTKSLRLPYIFAVLMAALVGGCGDDDIRIVEVLVPIDPPPPVFPQPVEVASEGGVLDTALVAGIATNTINDPAGDVQITGPTYNGGLIGPTFRVKPGDTIRVALTNDFPPNPASNRETSHQFPHDRYITNFHSHGLTVDPGGISDNVLRKMPPRATAGDPAPPPYAVEIQIPADHQTGTMWYHPHVHGSVSYQMFGGMAGFLIVEGGPGTLDAVPEVAAAEEVLMAFADIRVNMDASGDYVVPYVNDDATSFSTLSQMGTVIEEGLWNEFTGGKNWVTVNGVVNPTLHMQPGEVQRWRMLNAGTGITFMLTLDEHPLHVIANDGLTVPNMVTVATDTPLTLGAGNRSDVLVQAGDPGIYLLKGMSGGSTASITAQTTATGGAIQAGARNARIGGDFGGGGGQPQTDFIIATIVVSGDPVAMGLPAGPLPVAPVLETQNVLTAPLDAVRNVAFELCSNNPNGLMPQNRVSSCDFYFNRYDATYWGGLKFDNLLMARDADDDGVPIDPMNPMGPHTGYQKEGLFTPGDPLFDDMFVGNIEEWTVWNRTSSDHPFHIHVNPILVTEINGEALPQPEWRDTILIPAATGPANNPANWGSVKYRTRLRPPFTGDFVMHCHILTHEDVGMMQEITIKEVP